jgi:hypothetical protein
MTTSDGISSEDWDLLRELAVEVVNAEPGEDEELCRRRLLDYLDGLESKYGPLPSILATRADYLVDDVPGRVTLLSRAYALAAEAGDARNQLHIASSLAAIYIEEVENAAEGGKWLARAKEHLGAGTDVDRREYARVEKSLRRLQSHP